jgi:hypothetical protein
MKAGTIVGCRYRWPNKHKHPDEWIQPWKGEVLRMNDVRAWTDSMAFGKILYPQGPSQEAVDAKIEKIQKTGRIQGIPVLYTRENGTMFVSWEREATLSPYAEELAEWERQREERRARTVNEVRP